MPLLFRPTAKPKDGPPRISPVWHIRFFCPLRKRSHVITTGCKNRKNAEQMLRQFCDLLESSQVGMDNPFLKAKADRRNQVVSLRGEVEDYLAKFEVDLKAGRICKRGRREVVSDEHV